MRSVPKGKQYLRLIEAVCEAPTTPKALAAKLNLPLASVSSALSEAAKMGLIHRRLAPELHASPDGRGRKPYLYSATG